MKTIASLAVASVIATTSLATTSVTADAGGRYWKNNHYHGYHGRRYSNGWNPGAALATGAVLGLTFGALATPRYYAPPPPAYYYPPAPPPVYPGYYSYSAGPDANAQHVSWCYSRYRSYNAQYNTWVGYDGIVRECVSPIPY